MESSHGIKRKALLHIAVVCIIFFLTESFRYTIFKLAFQICDLGIPALLLQLLLDILNIGVVVSLYAKYLLKKSFSEIYLGKSFPAFRWCIAAVVLPAAINVFYLAFAQGTLQNGGLLPDEQFQILFKDIFVYGLRPAVADGMLFRGLALYVLQRGFGKKGGVFFSGFLYAVISLISNAALFWMPGRTFLLFSAAFLIGMALALVTCESGSVWSSVMIDTLYRAFGGNGQILHIDTEQIYPAIFTYTLKHDSWVLAGLSGAFALETALPAMVGFSIIIVLAVAGIRRGKKKLNSIAEKSNWKQTAAFDKMDSELEKPRAAKAEEKVLWPAYNILTNSLTGKMLKNLLNGLLAGTYLIFLLYFGSKNMLQEYFFTHYTEETTLIKELREYAVQNHITAIDVEKLISWAEDNDMKEFKIYREGWLLFDAAYPGELLPGIRKMAGSSWRPFYPVSFADGNADVYVSTGFDEAYYQMLLVFSVLLGFATCLWILISGMQENVAYIQCLEREVNAIRQGNLQEAVTVKGQDELSRLAGGLDQMRRQLSKKEQMEHKLRAAQEKLVLGMAHDLRTPLTGLLAYMEVIKKQAAAGIPKQEYIDKAYDKILQIRHLSDQMFEYFFIDSHEGVELEPPEEISSAFGDYLSELCAMLDCSGFCVNTGIPEWKHALVRVNTDYLGRIMNNIFSNLEKYGDKEKEIQIHIIYEPDKVGIAIQNRTAIPGQYVEGTGIGVKNICFMMEQMGGTAQIGMSEKDYWIVLYFPLYG